ncbi:hypothetical protein LCGC14_0428950 [marine sediment metagenome]|uniref:Uncharacterized protein n=1 Tax=marine sediment metagenome TaxID=412755 RepID=A0A0F9T6R2_9ZZZZ
MISLAVIDLDDVLGDFVGAVLEIHGWTREQLDAVRPIGTWDIITPMGMSTTNFWQPIKRAGPDWWESIKPFPWLQDLLGLVASVTDNWIIASTPQPFEECWTGKLRWVEKVFGKSFAYNRYVPVQHKRILAKKGVMLIDDKKENVRLFDRSDGTGVLFPSPNNNLYREAYDPVGYLVRNFIFKDQSNAPVLS